ncbi:p24 complex component [Entophlyctis luteolus]|nr:p24 complex component [Entophlyctis luteolus]
MTSGLWLRVLAALATIAAVIDASNNFHVTVPPRRKECFFEPMEPGQQLGLSFQVFGGESLEVDFLVSDPNDLIVKSIMRSSTGSLSIEATKVGTYKYCISNMGTSGGSEKQVSFSLLGPDEQKRRSDKGQAGNEEVMS